MNGDDILLDTNAIIAATAIVHVFPLVTADKRFGRVVDLRVIADILE